MKTTAAIRAQQLEQAVERILSLMNLSYMRVAVYRCPGCGKVFNRSAKGWPDFFVYHPIQLGIECKTAGGAITSAQHEVMKKLNESGIKTLIVRDTVDGLLIYLKEIGVYK